MQINRTQILMAEKLGAIAAFDIADPAMPATDIYDRVGKRMVYNRLGECQIFEQAHRAAFWTLLQDRAMPLAAAPQIGLILTDPRRSEDQKMATILHIISSYQAVGATVD